MMNEPLIEHVVIQSDDEEAQQIKSELMALNQKSQEDDSPGFRNAFVLEDGRIDCEIFHPTFGWIPFTADKDDVAEHGRLIHSMILATNPPPKKPPTEEELLLAKRSMMAMERSSFCLALHDGGFASLEDSRSAAKGEIPDSFLVGSDNASRIQILWAGERVIRRNSEFVSSISNSLGISPIEMDAIFNQEGMNNG